MKNIKNNGNKIVHIGTKALMPGDSVNVSDKAADVPAVKVLAKQNVLTVSDAAETASASTATIEKSAAATTTTADTTDSKKTTTKKSTTATTESK